MRSNALFLLIGTTLLLSSNPAAHGAPALTKQAIAKSYGQIPMSFELNAGQTDPRVRYLARGNGYMVFLTGDGALVRLHGKPGATISMKLAGSNRAARTEGLEILPGKVNYLIGPDPARWRHGIATYRTVKSANVYPGIDVLYYGNQRQLEYDFVLSPGANPGLIRLGFEGVDSLRLDSSGDLILAAGGVELRKKKPVAYQELGGGKRPVEVGYRIDKGMVRLTVGAYDSRKALIVDPVLVYSTYLGGASFDVSQGMVVDSSGSGYIVGFTASTNFPTTPGALQGTFNGGEGDGFLTKLNPAGNAPVFSTYVGGPGGEQLTDVAVDPAGNIVVTGAQNGGGFPVVNYPPPVNPPCCLGWVGKIDPITGWVLFGRYIEGTDNAKRTAVDSAGNIYVAGGSSRGDLPVANPHQAANQGGPNDVWLAKLSGAGSVLWCTYFGGNGRDELGGLVLDNSGNVYITGHTTSNNFPSESAYQAALSGDHDVFVSKFSTSGVLLYSTYLGGSGYDSTQGGAIAVDATGSAYVTGVTASGNFPILNPYQSTYAGGLDVFAAKLAPAGNALLYSTYLGGAADDEGHGIAVDATGAAYLGGETRSANFPVLNAVPPMRDALAGGRDGFLTKLNPLGNAVSFSAFFGGTNGNRVWVVKAGSPGEFYITGITTSADFPTQPPYQIAPGGDDVFVSKFREPQSIAALSPAHVWVGLKNSDDQGTQFDLRAELYKNGNLVSSGTTLCVTGITRNPSLAKEVVIAFGAITNAGVAPGDVLALKMLTRIGTNPDGSKCPGPGGSHSNATGLRLYYDAVARPSGFAGEITPNPPASLYLHSTGSGLFFNTTSPVGTTAKIADSAGVNFAGGNPWKEIGVWSRTDPW